MAHLEQLTKGTRVRGLTGTDAVLIVEAKWHGTTVLEVFYRDDEGKTGTELVYRDQEPSLQIEQAGAYWSFEGRGSDFRMAMEAMRIRLAHLFDPLLAVHTSQVIPLPHQITAVYEEMLTRQPLRYLLADDPGAGKTIMAGLLIKELIARGDLQRCMIVSPGMLVEQWQDELWRKFNLPFEILTNDQLESAVSGNWFSEHNLVICRLDKLSRNEEVQELIKACDWDLIVCDEAHKLSATLVGDEVSYTKRYRLGQMLSEVARNFLLLTATPHNGKDADFQLFLALLDGDRFEGRDRDGVHQIDPSDLIRRLVKEKLLKFDGSPLFPERRAYTVPYRLSDMEAKLYAAVTSYVSEEFNRADNLANERFRGNVGFALTSLQRRLASSPEAIYQSLRRRKDRLEKRLREEELKKRGLAVTVDLATIAGMSYDDADPEELPESELEEMEAQMIDQASAAQTIDELRKEIATLQQLETLALAVRNSGEDRKWMELSSLLQNRQEMFDSRGSRRKLVIFTEHRDTLNYLRERIASAIGRPEAVVAIHGGMGRDDRRKTQELFTQDKEVLILVATDAAGEGINLQRAHLMVNYDLPWNPNRLEQRFGRIHRIGQEEVCHLWNLVADETREGDVYRRLLDKLEEERQALGGQVFDVLGQLMFGDQPLWKLLLDAVRYGDDPERRQEFLRSIDVSLDTSALQDLIEKRALVDDAMDFTAVRKIREDMERADARRLQPHFIESFFLRAFEHLGGSIRQREPRRYEIAHVPVAIRRRDRERGLGDPILSRYERITFEKDLITIPGKALASFVCPGHPLLDAVISLISERYRDTLKTGAVLVDDSDDSEIPRVLCALEHDIRDGLLDKRGERRIISRRFQFLEVSPDGEVRHAGSAPYLDYRPLNEDELDLVGQVDLSWLGEGLEPLAVGYAVQHLVPEHFEEVNSRRQAQVEKARVEIHARLTSEISHWDTRAEELRLREDAGKQPKLNSEKARQRRDDLADRLKRRMLQLDDESRISRGVPILVGGALILPGGLVRKLKGDSLTDRETQTRETRRIELLAMSAVMELERSLGFFPHDVSADRRGYDIESIRPDGGLRFIEVKGRFAGADTVSVTKNEVLVALNKPEDYYLAIVEVDGDAVLEPIYIPQPFGREPDFGVTSLTYRMAELKARAELRTAASIPS
ncbi:MAG: DUF3883 domain-containing protein [Fimbriimonadaceae bacterium]|nr:DUF3883 domain-containing protein [Fimbriimonadaceae bacterium]